MADLIIRSRRVVTPLVTGEASVHIAEDKILCVREWSDVPAGVELIDAGNSVVMPGNVDAHVHVNEPGRTEWEGFETATKAAAAGGVTTIVDMPLNSIPPTTTLAGFEEKLDAAAGKCTVDVAFWGGVVPGNTAELAPLVERGVRGFKCFLIHSGVDEFPHVTESDLLIAMPEIARLGSVLLVHAEVPGPIDAVAESLLGLDPREYETFLRSRPSAAENEAIAMMIELARETGCRTHIVHLSSAEALPMLRQAKADGVPITAETCPHYLTFAAEEVPDGATHFKCCPPVRKRENRKKLWEALRDGTVDMVVSDHSPCTPALKLQETGDFMDAWGDVGAARKTRRTRRSQRKDCRRKRCRYRHLEPGRTIHRRSRNYPASAQTDTLFGYGTIRCSRKDLCRRQKGVRPRQFCLRRGRIEIDSMDDKSIMLRHFLASIAYRTQKALRDAPADFGSFAAGDGVRTPAELVRHMASVLGYAGTFFTGGEYRPEPLPTFDDEIERLHRKIAEIAGHIEDGSPFLEGLTPERLLQGPFSDAMTHAGQLAMLRRLAGEPVAPENFIVADIDATRLGRDQALPVSPDEFWPEAPPGRHLE